MRSVPHPDLERVDVGGYALAVRRQGQGAPLVLVHGSLSDYRSWALQMPAFAAHYTTLAPSLRHCWPDHWDDASSDFNVEQHAEDIAALVDTLGASAHVVGHSRGGAVALQLALRHPERVRSLVLADPGGLEGLLPDTEAGRAMGRESAQMFAALRDTLAEGGPLAAARAFVDALGGTGAWERRTPGQQQLLLDNIETGPACAERPSWTAGQLAGLACPIQLITGARSPERYPLMIAELARCNANVKSTVIVGDAAHAMHRENPAEFNAAVLDFLATQCA
ncbi:MAG: alpha/beta hydrolase [Pseudomonadota bacterium]